MLIEAPEISLEEQKKYAGKHVAIVDGKIVASGNTAKEAFQKAKLKFPEKRTEEIGLMYIPKEELMIL
ncbi:succinyl-CoA synthetase subunit alpha [Archaeoglobales archaeon]|nr:MAG: succinyl-CoA synthetase subunit alpha [Archaeoglobales archaeon]